MKNESNEETTQIYDPTLSSVNYDLNLNLSFDSLVENVKIAGSLDWSEIDTSDFQGKFKQSLQVN